MTGETNLSMLIKGMKPILNEGDYVFCSVKDLTKIPRKDTLCEFKEKEGTTIVIGKGKADELHLNYDFVASWILITMAQMDFIHHLKEAKKRQI